MKIDSVVVLGDVIRPVIDDMLAADRGVQWLEELLRPVIIGSGLNLRTFSTNPMQTFRQIEFYSLMDQEPMEKTWGRIALSGEVSGAALSYLMKYVGQLDFVIGCYLSNFFKSLLTSMGISYINLRAINLPFCSDLLFWCEWNRESIGAVVKSRTITIGELGALERAYAMSQRKISSSNPGIIIVNDAIDPILYEWGLPLGFEPYENELVALLEGAPISIFTQDKLSGERHLRFLARRFPQAKIMIGDDVPIVQKGQSVVCLSPVTALRIELGGQHVICLSLAEANVVDILQDDPMQALLPAESLFSNAFWGGLIGIDQNSSPVSFSPKGLFRESYENAIAQP